MAGLVDSSRRLDSVSGLHSIAWLIKPIQPIRNAEPEGYPWNKGVPRSRVDNGVAAPGILYCHLPIVDSAVIPFLKLGTV